jgi:uncharacterized protein (UPF0210 family)
MKIRSITYFCNPHWPLDKKVLAGAGKLIAAARSAFEEAGYEVQTVRLATLPFPDLLPTLRSEELVQAAKELESAGNQLGFGYIALGPALPECPESYPLIPDAIAATSNVFFCGMMTTEQGGVSLPAVYSCAEVIHRIAPIAAEGFANLRFAAIANVPAGGPFLPAAYYQDRPPAFALATQAADLAVEAFSSADSLAEGRQRLIASIEDHAQTLAQVGHRLEKELRVHFGGLDFSLAPFPQVPLSFGTAIERLGVPAVGLHGSLAAAAILADTLDRAHYPRAGFNGLFLPLLEDATLAMRAAERVLTLKDLLLYSAVCGTGLDTIPLPGKTTVEQMASILVDVAALAQRLDKPLAARLMPIPGKKAGDVTEFDFHYFANSRVLEIDAQPLQGFLHGDETFTLNPR